VNLKNKKIYKTRFSSFVCLIFSDFLQALMFWTKLLLIFLISGLNDWSTRSQLSFGFHTVKTLYRKFKQIFSEMKLRCFVPSFYIRVSLSELYISMIGSPILLQQNRWTDIGIHECGNWEWGCAVSFLGIHKSDLVCSEAHFSVWFTMPKLTAAPVKKYEHAVSLNLLHCFLFKE
jgi:hypothetical protein